MKIKSLSRLLLATILSLSSLLVIAAPRALAAGSLTWTGTDCVATPPASGSDPNGSGVTDCNWNDPNNWSTNTIPGADGNGDTLTFSNAIIGGASAAGSSTDNIGGLNVGSLLFTNNSSTNTTEIVLGQPLTVSAAISQDSTVTTTTDFIGGSVAASTLTLGGNVTVTASSGFSLGDFTGDALALAGNTLTFNSVGSAGNTVAILDNITGNGSVVFDSPNTDFQLDGANTYTGTTDVIADTAAGNTSLDNNAFGASAITVGQAGTIQFDYDTNTTVSNAITVAGTTSGSPITSISFGPGGGTSPVTLTVPNITLSGDTSFANGGTVSAPVTVDLAGITANGHCVQYIGPGSSLTDGPSNGFTNGPAGCVIVNSGAGTGTGAAAPKTPNTGLAAIVGNPLAVIGTSVAAAASLVVVARRLKPAIKH